MKLYILNKDLETIDVIDEYISLIWTTRYFTNGDFELYCSASQKLLNLLQIGNYITRHDCICTMIIEKIEITTDADNGNVIIASGRSLESLLSRRIVWGQLPLNDTAEICMRKIVDANLIRVGSSGFAPTYDGILPNQYRSMNGFILGELKGYSDKLITQFAYDNVQEAVEEIAKTYGYGWRVILNDENFIFEVYKGLDRTYSQTENIPCIFNSSFGNLITSDYVKNFTNYKNSALIKHDDTKVQLGTISGVDRYELLVEADDLSQETTDADEWTSIMQARGHEKLSETHFVQSLSGEVDPDMTKYKKDFNLGDIVQIDTEYGITGIARIIEIIESYSDSEQAIIPTFSNWEVITE